jgi:hypothetical protein
VRNRVIADEAAQRCIEVGSRVRPSVDGHGQLTRQLTGLVRQDTCAQVELGLATQVEQM